jgi:hypothetical protein
VRRTGRGKSTGAGIHICVGTTQGISLCSSLSQTSKSHVSYFICHVFSSTKSDEDKDRFCVEAGVENDCGANNAYTCTYVNVKMVPAETIPGIGGGEREREAGGGGGIQV